MLLKQNIKIKWRPNNIRYYESHGYIYTKVNDEFEVNVKHLSKSSRAEVKIKCDYCDDVFYKTYKIRNDSLKKSIVKKDCCKECYPKRREENNLIKYGKTSPAGNEDVLNKRRETSLKRYGETHHMKNEEFRDNFFENNIEKLGVRYPAQNEKVMEKRRKTINDKYGVDSILEIPEVKEKGLDALKKSKRDRISKQQMYISNLFNEGILNLRVGKYFLDIAFPNEKIFIEYDGSGHNLSVKLGNITQEEFDKKEKARFAYLYNNGWREIRIISANDLLPDKDYLYKRILNKINKLREINYMMRTVLYIEKIDDVNLHRVKGDVL